MGKIVKSKKRVYVDLDGVLADFNQGIKNMSGQDPKDLSEEAQWKIVNESPSFWVDLPVMHGAVQLMQFLSHHEHVMILSSPGTKGAPRARKQKLDWIRNRAMGGFLVAPGGGPIPLILRRGKHKAEYAWPDAILIDDTEENIKRWIDKGGIGILHTKAALTIASLSKLKLFEEVDEFTGE